MSDDHMKIAIDVNVRSTGEELVAQLTRQLSKLESQIKSINAASKSAANASRPQTSGRNPSSAGTSAAQGEAKAKRQTLIFGREEVKLFRSRMTSQARASADAMKAERQSFADYKSRIAAKAKFRAEEVRTLRDRMTAESRIAAMRVRAENESVRALKAKLASQDRAARQRVTEATAAARTEARQNAEAIRSVRDRISAHSRMTRQRLAEEKSAAREQARSIADAARLETRRMREAAAAIRENGRIEAAQVRHAERERSRHETARNRNIANLRSGGNDIREGTGRVVRGSAQITAATTAPAVLAARKSISTRMEVESQETNLRIFSGQSTEQIRAARKGFLDNEAIKNGLSIAGGLEAYSEVLKTGMKAPEANTKTIMAAVSALELDLRNTTKLAGLIDRNLGARSDPAKIKSALNAVAVAAREDPTQSNEIVEGVKRSFGALSTGNLTPEQLTAMVSGGQSVGIQPGKAGTFVATMAKQLSMGSSKFLGKKNRDELNFAARELGFSDARSLAQTYSKDSYNTMMQVHEKLAKMEAAKRTQVAEALYGRQWSDEGLQMAQGVGGVRKTYGEITDSKNANFLEEAARQRAESLQGQWNSTKSIFGRFWDSFGQGFEDILNSINQYFLELNSSFDYDKVKSYVVSFFDGVKDALGVKTWQEFLRNVFGGDIGNIGPQIRAFAKGLTEGVMSIGRAIKSFASVFGGDMSAETVGRLSGQFIALTASLVLLAPVLSILGGLASIVVGLAVATKALAGIAGLATRGAASSAAGAATGTGLLFKGLGLALSRMFALTVVAEIGENRGVISTWLLDAGKSILNAAVDGLKQAFSKEAILSAMKGIVNEVIPAPVQRWMDNDGQLEAKKGLGKRTLEGLPKSTPSTPVDPNERGYIGKAWDWINSSLIGSAAASELPPGLRGQVNSATAIPNEAATPSLDPRPAMEGLKDAIEESTLLHRQSLDKAEGFGGLIHRASISTTTPANAVKASITESASIARASILSGSTGTGAMTGGSAPPEGSTPGSRMGGGGGLGYRGIIGGSGSSRGAGPGAGGMVGFGANPSAYKPVLNFIAGTEGTARQAGGGYSTSLGYGKFLPGGKEQNLTGKTLDEIDALQGGMLSHPQNGFNSSAIGRYQIVRKTLRGLRQKLGLKGSDLYDEKMQDRLGAELVRQRGASASGLGQEWASLRGGKASQAAGLVGNIPSGASTTPSTRPITASQVIGGTVGTDAASNVAANAEKLVGLGSSQAAQALGSKMTPGSWCGDFVNGALKSANLKGVNSSIANSFLSWGREVTDGVKAGDVLVEHRGRGVGQTGGHAGIATGNSRMGPRGLQLEQVSGNYGGRVARNWEDASGVVARRALEATRATAEAVKQQGPAVPVVKGEIARAPVVEAIKTPVPTARKSTDWNKFGVPTMGAPAPSSDPDGKSSDTGKVQVGRSQRKVDPSTGLLGGVKRMLGIGGEVAAKAEAIRSNGWRPAKAEALTLGDGPPGSPPPAKPSLGDGVAPRVSNTAPIGGGGGGGGGKGSSSSINAPITIQGTGMDANAIANAVQRRLSEDMNRRTHDISPSIV